MADTTFPLDPVQEFEGMRSTFVVTGADGQPVVIPKKQWYITSKARPQRLMRNGLSTDARQIYAALELATMGWKQELAVKWEKQEKVPLAPSDLVEQTGLSPEQVRRALVELEEEGLGIRRSVDDGPLRKGKVEIYSFAVPRPVQKPKFPPRAGGILELNDTELKPLQTFLKRWKIIPDDGITPAREGLKALADDIAEWESKGNALRARAETLCAPSRINKEERNVKELIKKPLPTDRPLVLQAENPKPNAVGRSVEDCEDKSTEAKTEPPIPPPPPSPEAKPLPEIGALATEIRAWLVKTYALPTAPSTEVLAELARSCRDEAGFEQFKTECAKTQNADPKSYRYFLPIARRCAEHRPEYEEALRLKKAMPISNGFDEERVRRLVAQVEEDRKWR